MEAPEDVNKVQEEEEMEEDSSSDENDDADDETQKQIEEISEKLIKSPFEYQSHITLIQLLKKVGELEKLRDARSQMAKIFPLTQALWLEWIEDEKKFAESEEDHNKIVEIFEKAVKDYMCPEVWLEYAQYCIRWMDMEDGLKRIREVMERSICAVGLHVTEGAALWEMYREFENAILLSTQPTPGSVPSTEQQERIKKQSDKILSLFKRQLAIPLLDMESTFQEFTDWCDEDINPNIRKMYEQSLKQLEELKPFEDALVKADPPKLEIYQDYIQHEIKSGSPVRVQYMYERALVENCLNSELWMQYLKYMRYQLKSADIFVEHSHRSVRNCPWIGQFWVFYLLSLERNKASKEKLDEVFTEALLAGFTTAYEYLELWKTKCSQIRRSISQDDCTEKEKLRECFVKATEYINDTLIPAFDESGDTNFSMWTFWAKCEAGCLGSKDKAIEILNTLTQDNADARRKFCVWREMYDIERLYGDEEKIEKCRSILRQAVQNCAILPDSERGGVADAEVACDMLLDFERQFGSMDDMDESLRRVTNKMARVDKRREKEAATYANQQAKNKDWQNKQKTNKPVPGPKKRKFSGESQESDKQVAGGFHKHPKRAKESEPAAEDKSFKAPTGLPMRYGNQTKSSSQQDPTSSKKSAPSPGFKGPPPPGFKGTPPPGFKTPPPPGFKGNPPPGYKPPPTDLNNNKGEKVSADKTAKIESTRNTDSGSESDKNTIFVSNLDFKLQQVEEKLRNVFCNCGKVVDVRLAKNNKDQFRGFGFIEFMEHSSVEKALKLDRQDIDGRPLFVSPNVDKRQHPNFKVFKYDLGLERHKLFVSNLSFHTTEDRLREEFLKHGPVKEVRIVTNRKGLSKGLAFVEYENESDASQAVLKTDGKELDGYDIKVAISNPPSRRPNGDPPSSLGGGNREQIMGGRGRGRTQLSMLPRSVKRSDARTPQNGNSSVPSTSSGGMSNKDFAKLLLKK